MAGFRFHFPDFTGSKVRPDDAIKVRLPRRSTDEEISVLAHVVAVSVLRFLQRDFLNGLARQLRIKLAKIMTIASSPHKAMGSEPLVTAGPRPLCDLPRRGVQHSEIVGPRFGENNLSVLRNGEPVLAGVLSRRDRDRILLCYSGAWIELSNNRTAI